jgi:mannose-6-phosphate isomerase
MAGEDAPKVTGQVSVTRPRLDEKPWGGRGLARYGLDLPPGVPVGEALVTADDAEIVSGAGAGRTLGDVVAAGHDLLGPAASRAVHGRAIFPLLVKLIDASENLSIQVHPNDAQAAPLGKLGKSEAWYVLAAEPDAALYVGLREGATLDMFRRAAERLDGSSAELLRRVTAEPGRTIMLPANTIHALGAGVMVYEIQQPSDVTYRLDDWGRVDAEGNPREMHLDAGFAVANPESRPGWLEAVALDAAQGRRELLVTADQFALERIRLAAGERVSLPSLSGPQVVTLLEGIAGIGGERLAAGRSAVAWPGGAHELTAEEPIVALRAWVPEEPPVPQAHAVGIVRATE